MCECVCVGGGDILFFSVRLFDTRDNVTFIMLSTSLFLPFVAKHLEPGALE